MKDVEDYMRRMQKWEDAQLQLEDQDVGQGLRRKSGVKWDNSQYQSELRRTEIGKVAVGEKQAFGADVDVKTLPRPPKSADGQGASWV